MTREWERTHTAREETDSAAKSTAHIIVTLRSTPSRDSFPDATGSPRGRMVTLLSAGLTFVLPVVETTADFFDGIVRIDGDAERMPYGL